MNRSPVPQFKGQRRRPGFVDLSLRGLRLAHEQSVAADELARSNGLLQGLDPRVKVLALAGMTAASAFSSDLWLIFGIFLAAVALAAASRVPLRLFAFGLWPGLFFFTGCLELPALFLTSGPAVAHLPWLGWPVRAAGIYNAALVLSRAETAATLGALLILCTPWTYVLKALRVLHVPVVAVTILGMTHRYIFVFIGTALAMFESRRSRTVGRLHGSAGRQVAAATAGVMLSKSIRLSEEVHLAMRSRGFQGEPRMLHQFALRRRDWAALALLGATTAAWMVLR